MPPYARSLCAPIAATVIAGCAAHGPVTHPDALRLERAGLAVEALPDIDRLTYFGPAGGPNMLLTRDLEQPPAEDGGYTFYGGCYTWVAPQNGPLGWRNDAGEPSPWPPDPAMDVGPADLVGRTKSGFTTRTPASRADLREIKTFTLHEGGDAIFSYVLRNEGDDDATVGAWINTAVHPGAIVAVRFDPEADAAAIWGWNQQSIDRFLSILEPADAEGWSLVRPGAAAWEGGAKVYLHFHPHFSPTSMTAPEIAVWRDGHWLHRIGLAPVDAAKLRAVGEGPVAIYVQPGDADSAIVEAELYGPLDTLAPGQELITEERWTIIASETPSVRAMLEALR